MHSNRNKTLSLSERGISESLSACEFLVEGCVSDNVLLPDGILMHTNFFERCRGDHKRKMSSEENTPSNSVQDLVQDGKNCKIVMCLHCPSKILNPNNGTYRKVEFSLPETRCKRVAGGEEDSPKEELLSDFWLIEDMYRFENMGFSHSVGNVKYLACADCEMGPIGLYQMDTKCSYVAIARVRHGT